MMMPSMVDLEQTSQYDFSRARMKAGLRALLTRLLGRANDLLALDSVVKDGQLKNQHALGVRTVAIDQIVGSTARTKDFDRSFYPRNDTSRERWRSVDKANYAGVPLPPVELRKVGEQYFVVDGHHRISVARHQGQRFVDAHVIEMVIMNRM